jgi:hypothetical protein
VTKLGPTCGGSSVSSRVDQARAHVRWFFGFFPASTGVMAGFPIRSGSTPDRAIPSFRVRVSFFDLVLLFFLIQTVDSFSFFPI